MEAAFPALSKGDVNQLGMLELAYLGDTVCDLYVRSTLVRRGICRTTKRQRDHG